MSFCLSGIFFKFQLTDGEDLLALSAYDSAPALIYDAFIEVMTLYSPFGLCFLAWDHLYIIHCSPCFLLWVLYCFSLEHFKCDVDGAST